MAGAGELELWLNRATDPSVPEENWACIQRFCDRVNVDSEGPSLAPRLLAHKIQSPQEMEALHALTVLETCVNNCGERFHREIAKFRFLNELIKVLSPKYYGSWSSDQVKSRVTQVLFSWTVWFPQEVKVRDAYQMLKKQGIVKADPKLPEDRILPPPSPRPRSSIFDTDEERCKLLERLLKSSRSEDLQAANRLIRRMIEEEQEKAAKASRRANAVREVSEVVEHMKEIQENYNRQGLSPSDQDTLQTLPQRCERLQPLLFRLARETADDDEALAEILQASDELSRALGQYRQLVASHESGGGGGSGSGSAEAPACRPAPRRVKSYTLIDFSELEATSQSPTDGFAVGATSSRHDGSSTTSACLLAEEFQALGLSSSPGLKKAPLDSGAAGVGDPQAAAHDGDGDAGSSAQLPRAQDSWEGDRRSSEENEPQGLLHQLSPLPWTRLLSLDFSLMKPPFPAPPEASAAATSCSSPGCELMPAASLHPASQDAALDDLFVPLTSITLSSISPLTVYDRKGVKAMLHFASAPAPGHPDVLVMVLSMLNTAAQPIQDIMFQAAVPKTMRIKLQPASGSELPAFSPLLPPALVSQVLLLSNPHGDAIRLRYKLVFTQGAQPITEVGELTGFPRAEPWGSG